MNSNMVPDPIHVEEAARELIYQWSKPGQPRYDLIELAAKMVRHGLVVQLGVDCYRVGFESSVAQPEVVTSSRCTCFSTNLITPCVHRLAVQIYQNALEPPLIWDFTTEKGKTGVRLLANPIS